MLIKQCLVAFFSLIAATVCCQSPELVLPIGHTHVVEKALLTSDGKILVTASRDATAKIWNYRTGKLMHNLVLHKNDINDIALTSDNKLVVLASKDGTYSTWNLTTGKLVYHNQEGYLLNIKKCFVLSGDSTALLHRDHLIEIVNIKKESEPIVIDDWNDFQITERDERLGISKDGKIIAKVFYQKTVEFYDAASGDLIYESATGIPDAGKYAVLKTQDPEGVIFFKATDIPEEIQPIIANIIEVSGEGLTNLLKNCKALVLSNREALSLSNNNDLLAVLNVQRDSIFIWSFSKQELRSIIASPYKRFHLRWFADDDSALIVETVYGIEKWSVNGTLVKSIAGNTVNYQSDKTFLSQSSHPVYGNLKLIDINTGTVMREFAGKVAEVKYAKITANGRYIFEVKSPYSNYWDVKLARPVRLPKLFDESVGDVFMLNDTNHVLLSYFSAFALYNLKQQKIVYHHKENSLIHFCVPGGDVFFTIAYDNVLKQLKQWKTSTGELIKELPVNHYINKMAFSPDGKWLAGTRGEVGNDSVHVWNMLADTLAFSFERHSEFNYTPAIQFSRNSDMIFFSYEKYGWLGMYKMPYEEKMEEYEFTYQYDGRLVHTAQYEYFSRGLPVVELPGSKILLTTSAPSSSEQSIAAIRLDAPDEWYDRFAFKLSHPEQQDILALNKKGTVLYTVSNDELLVWDLPKKNIINKVSIPTGMWATSVCEATQQLLVRSNDRIGLIPLNGKKPSFYLSTFNSGDYIAYRSDRFYLASPSAASASSWKMNDKLYDFDQWDMQYNRPDKIAELMNGAPSELSNAYYKAYKKRLAYADVKEEMLNSNLSLPELKLQTAYTDGELLSTEIMPINIICSDAVGRSGLTKLFVTVNDNPLYGASGMLLNGNQYQNTLNIQLAEGSNIIKAWCMNDNGTSSLKQQLQVFYKPHHQKPAKTWFIGIGINEFTTPEYNLSWSVKDIADLANHFAALPPSQVHIDTLFNQDVTAGNVKAIKSKLMQTGVNDKVIIAYSGHGLLDKSYNYYLSSYHVNFSDPSVNGIAYEVFEQLLDGIPARQKLMLIDACHSGEVDKEELLQYEQVQQELDSTKKGLTILVKKGNTGKSSFQLMQELFMNTGKGTGASIISAAAGTQFALERGDLQNGVFTFAILEYLQKNKNVTVQELKEYVNERVTELTKGVQKPSTRGSTTYTSWIVW